MAANRNTGAKFPCPRRLWQTCIREVANRSGALDRRLASHNFFPYASFVMTSEFLFWPSIRKISIHTLAGVALLFAFCAPSSLGQAQPSPQADAKAPVVTKVEPPSWWTNL